MREIVLDTETTGFDPDAGDRIVEIGCIELVNHLATGKVLHIFINPERDMPQGAFEVHGLSAEFLSQYKPFIDHADEIVEFIGDSPMVIHNASFDMKFLNWELRMAGRGGLPDEQAIDTLMIARRKFPGSPASLDVLCKRFGIDNSSRDKHGALLDSELLAEVYLDLIGKRQSALALGQSAGENLVQTGRLVGKRQTARPTKLEPRLTSEEAEAHAEFIKTLGGAVLWQS